ncbi:MAG: ATP-binding protein [Puia sp.]|nr:ATP-binding protein [Puia sp.]
MRKWFLIVATAMAALPVFGQTSWMRARDSLLKLLPAMKDDTPKVWVLVNLGVGYLENQPDSANYYAKLVEELSGRIHFPDGMANGLSMQAVVLGNQNKPDEAIAMDLKAVEVAKTVRQKRILANVYNNTAILYNSNGRNAEGLDFYLKAAAIYEGLNDTSSMAFVYGNIASVYEDLREYKSGYEYSLKGVSLCRSLRQTHGLGSGLINVSNALINLGRYDSALVVLREAEKVVKDDNDVTKEIEVLANMDYAYAGLEKFEPIKPNAEELMGLAKSIDSKNGICYALFGLTDFYLHEKKYEKAGYYIREAIGTALDNKLIVSLRDAYRKAAEVEMAKGNLSAYRNYDDLRDSMDNIFLSDKILKNTQELEAKYSLNKKQAEIDNLNKQQQTQQLILRQDRIINWTLGILLALIGLAALLYGRNYRQKKKLLEADARLQQQRISELEKEKQLLAAQAVLQGQVEERTRLAKDLHDGLGSILSSAKYSFTNMKENLIITPENAEAFERSMGMLDRSISELRRVAHNMMPESLMKFGLDTALKDFCNSVDQTGAIQLVYQSFDIEEASVPAVVSSAVYRIIQELVNNILKHAHATTALVQLIRKGNALSITVEDNGQGFDTGILEKSTGIGYLNLKNRVAYLNGTMDIQTGPGKGTSVNIEI